jgi:hypothetical protein
MMLLTVVNSYTDKELKKACEEGRWSGMCRGMEASPPYDMNGQEKLCLAWMHGQWMGSMGKEKGPTWASFKMTDSYRKIPCGITYYLDENWGD